MKKAETAAPDASGAGGVSLTMINEADTERGVKAELLNLRSLNVSHLGRLTECTQLVFLIVADNFLTDLHAIIRCRNLKLLDVSKNHLETLPESTFWAALPNLQLLNLNGNLLSSYKIFEYLSYASSLDILSLKDTPLSLKPHYRHCCVNVIQTLKILDSCAVSDEEVVEDLQFSKKSVFSRRSPKRKVASIDSSKLTMVSFHAYIRMVNSHISHFSPTLIIQRYWRGSRSRRILKMLSSAKALRERMSRSVSPEFRPPSFAEVEMQSGHASRMSSHLERSLSQLNLLLNTRNLERINRDALTELTDYLHVELRGPPKERRSIRKSVFTINEMSDVKGGEINANAVEFRVKAGNARLYLPVIDKKSDWANVNQMIASEIKRSHEHYHRDEKQSDGMATSKNPIQPDPEPSGPLRFLKRVELNQNLSSLAAISNAYRYRYKLEKLRAAREKAVDARLLNDLGTVMKNEQLTKYRMKAAKQQIIHEARVRHAVDFHKTKHEEEINKSMRRAAISELHRENLKHSRQCEIQFVAQCASIVKANQRHNGAIARNVRTDLIYDKTQGMRENENERRDEVDAFNDKKARIICALSLAERKNIENIVEYQKKLEQNVTKTRVTRLRSEQRFRRPPDLPKGNSVKVASALNLHQAPNTANYDDDDLFPEEYRRRFENINASNANRAGLHGILN